MIVLLVLAMMTMMSTTHSQQVGPFRSNLQKVPILKYVNDINPDGSYVYEYQTGHGISAKEQGYLKNRGNPQTEAQVMQGSYSYTGPDGVRYTVTYIADENGFRAEGAHIPTPPPIPVDIQKALQFIATQQRIGSNRF